MVKIRENAVGVHIGQKYGLLTVIGPPFSNGNFQWWVVVNCECGLIMAIRADQLLRSGSGPVACKKCGNRAATRTRKLRYMQRTTPNRRLFPAEWISWQAMKRRCTKPSPKQYAHYVGRGITVCDRWLNSFQAFVEDMGPRPSPKHTLDRIDNDGNYEPGNCRWATWEEQGHNRRSTRILEFNGTQMSTKGWSRRLGIAEKTIRKRLKMGMPLDAVFATSDVPRSEHGQFVPSNWHPSPDGIFEVSSGGHG